MCFFLGFLVATIFYSFFLLEVLSDFLYLGSKRVAKKWKRKNFLNRQIWLNCIMNDHPVQLHHKYERTGGDQYAVAYDQKIRGEVESCEPLRNGCTEREEEKQHSYLAILAAICVLPRTVHCTTHSSSSLSFSLFSALLGYVQSISRLQISCLDFRSRVIFFFRSRV